MRRNGAGASPIFLEQALFRLVKTRVCPMENPLSSAKQWFINFAVFEAIRREGGASVINMD